MSESKPRYYHEGDDDIRMTPTGKPGELIKPDGKKLVVDPIGPYQPNQAFRVKPLEWQKQGTTEMAWVFGGSYMATSTDWGFRCGDGVDDASGEGFESIDDAKAAAERHWQERIKQCLEVIQ